MVDFVVLLAAVSFLLRVSFALQNFCSFMRSHLSIGDLRAKAIVVLSRNIFLVLICSRFYPNFLSIRFSVSGFICRVLIHLEFGLLQGDNNETICNLLHTDHQLNNHNENAVFFPVDDLSSFIKDKVTIGICVHFWVFNSVPFIYLPVSLTMPYRFLSVTQCEVRGGDSPRFFYC